MVILNVKQGSNNSAASFILSTCASKYISALFFLWMCILYLNYVVYFSNVHISFQSVKKKDNESRRRNERLPSCTTKQLNQITIQLPSKKCVEDETEPWLERCSFTLATKVLRATWLTKYYTDLHHLTDPIAFHESFVGISVGCGEGFRALDVLQMGTSNDKLKAVMWRDAMDAEGHVSGGHYISTAHNLSGEMHCIEPFTPNFNKLKRSAENLGFDREGFIVTNAAISKRGGLIAFPGANATRTLADVGIRDCTTNTEQKIKDGSCMKVDGYTLDDYVETHVRSNGPIHILSIDVEGFDFDVMLGGKHSALDRVQYIEFEYHYRGAWATQLLSDAVDMLDEYGFTCYWAGNDVLYRINGCWHKHYNIHHLANVACVHRKQHHLAEIMENKFLRTLTQTQKFSSEAYVDPILRLRLK